ncbi:E3 SUMO-protein ligase SIZ1-like protein, partial [Drosera capensis]
MARPMIISRSALQKIEENGTILISIHAFDSYHVTKCEDSDCRLWQHIACVFIPDNPGDDVPSPKQFFCEICRLKRADPFWETVGSPVTPRKLAVIHNPDDGGDPLQTLEKTFQLTKAESQLLKKAEYDVQAWCILFNDKVPFRMQWPKYTDLQINGIPVRTVNRPGSQLLGANGRDDGAKISMFISEGVNKISVSGCDARVFCFGVRLVKRRTVEQVFSMIPKEADGESLEIAIARVQRCIGGGISTQKEGSNNDDDDLEVISDAITMSGSRMRTAGRFKSCAHIGCFDLETFVKLNERSRKWQCPICIKNYSLEDLIIDPYFNRVVTMMQNVGEEITEIDVKPDGCWRVRKASEFMDLAAWHHPDGTTVLSSSVSSKLDEQEARSKDSSLRLGIQNHNDLSENLDQKVITMSSSDSGDDLENEAASINQNCSEQIGNLGNNANEVDSMLHNGCPMRRADNRSCGVPDVIVLSDSEDEVSLVYPESMSAAVLDPDEKFSIPHQIPDASCIKKNDDYLMVELLHTASVHSEPFFRLSDIDTNDSGAVVDVEPISVTCSSSNSGSLSLMFDVNPGGPVPNSSLSHHDAASHSGLVNNHLDYVEENLSLQRSLLAQTSLTKQLPVGSSSNVENHIRLGLETNKTAVETFQESVDASDADMEEQCRSTNGPSPQCDLGSNLNSSRKSAHTVLGFGLYDIAYFLSSDGLLIMYHRGANNYESGVPVNESDDPLIVKMRNELIVQLKYNIKVRRQAIDELTDISKKDAEKMKTRCPRWLQ